MMLQTAPAGAGSPLHSLTRTRTAGETPRLQGNQRLELVVEPKKEKNGTRISVHKRGWDTVRAQAVRDLWVNQGMLS